MSVVRGAGRRRLGRLPRTLLASTLILAAFQSALAEPRVIDLAIRGGQLAKDKQVVKVRQGDDVTLRWTTDKTVAIHLHGYDIEKTLTPATPVVMQFSARATGRFPIEAHPRGVGAERTLGYLEVHPR